MLDHFQALSPEKQTAIRIAAFTAFGRNGYQKTSMREIAEAAEISKAALFHYFGNKESLYLYLLQFAGEIIGMQVEEKSSDFFACIEHLAMRKLQMMYEYPGLADFLTTLNRHDSPSPPPETRLLIDTAQTAHRLFVHVDWIQLRSGVDPATAVHLLNWVVEGCTRTHQHLSKDELLAEVRRVVSLLKPAIVRESTNQSPKFW